MSDYLTKQLQRYFRYDSFRPGQKEIIGDVLKGCDVLGILPTGSGKSLCYQLPSRLLSDLTVVVSPLISLMVDQVRETKAFHFKEVAALHSFLSYEERTDILTNLHRYKIVYLSPELLQNRQIIGALKKRKVSLFVIDEAHCISQWGHDFRPDYLRLKLAIDLLGNPPLLALSGTVTAEIEQDILEQLERPAMKVHRYPLEQKNIALVVEKLKRNKTKDERLVEILRQKDVPTIIYFSSKQRAEETARLLKEQLPDREIAYYHGDLDPESRLKIQQQFLYDQVEIICATSAFGMGINKPNIRLVIHYHMPPDKESFIQEIGRAARDGKESVSILLFEEGDQQLPFKLIESELPTEQEIRKFLDFLYILHERNEPLPKDYVHVSEMLHIHETKIKLLKFHFETHGIIEDNKVCFDEASWKRTMAKIRQLIDARKRVKQKNVMNMLHYVHSEHCLRQELYKGFQRRTETEKANCCSVCGLSLPDVFKRMDETKKPKTHPEKSWKQRLAKLLEVGE